MTGSSSSAGDMTSQNFHQKKGTSPQIRLFTTESVFNLKKNEFLSPDSFFSTQN